MTVERCVMIVWLSNGNSIYLSFEMMESSTNVQYDDVSAPIVFCYRSGLIWSLHGEISPLVILYIGLRLKLGQMSIYHSSSKMSSKQSLTLVRTISEIFLFFYIVAVLAIKLFLIRINYIGLLLFPQFYRFYRCWLWRSFNWAALRRPLGRIFVSPVHYTTLVRAQTYRKV